MARGEAGFVQGRAGVAGQAVALLGLAPLLLGCAHHRAGPDAELRFGVEAARHGLWREARMRFARATELRPADARAWNDLAVALEAEGEIDAASAAYQRAVELEGGSGEARRNFDRFLGHHRDAIQDAPATQPAAEAP